MGFYDIQCQELLPGGICAISKLIPGKEGRKKLDAIFDKTTGICYADKYSKRNGIRCCAFDPEATVPEIK